MWSLRWCLTRGSEWSDQIMTERSFDADARKPPQCENARCQTSSSCASSNRRVCVGTYGIGCYSLYHSTIGL